MGRLRTEEDAKVPRREALIEAPPILINGNLARSFPCHSRYCSSLLKIDGNVHRRCGECLPLVRSPKLGCGMVREAAE